MRLIITIAALANVILFISILTKYEYFISDDGLTDNYVTQLQWHSKVSTVETLDDAQNSIEKEEQNSKDSKDLKEIKKTKERREARAETKAEKTGKKTIPKEFTEEYICGSIKAGSSSNAKKVKRIIAKHYDNNSTVQERAVKKPNRLYQVLIDTNKLLSQASSFSRQLAAKGISDHFIILESKPNSGSISLGVFKEKKRAQARLNQVKKQFPKMKLIIFPIISSELFIDYKIELEKDAIATKTETQLDTLLPNFKPVSRKCVDLFRE